MPSARAYSRMYVVDLFCKDGHPFEGWYDTKADFSTRLEQKEISCPICGLFDIQRRPSAPRLMSGLKELTKTEGKKTIHVAPDQTIPIEIQRAIAKVLQKVRQTHDDVGQDFARLAIAMARNEEPIRPIYGESSTLEEKQMDEEGVPFFKVPVPDIENN